MEGTEYKVSDIFSYVSAKKIALETLRELFDAYMGKRELNAQFDGFPVEIEFERKATLKEGMQEAIDVLVIEGKKVAFAVCNGEAIAVIGYI